jgi:hypothetical protein
VQLAYLDAAVELAAGLGFLALAGVIVQGLVSTHETSLRRNPLAYATVWIFVASVAHRILNARAALPGAPRLPEGLRLGVDAAVLVGLVGYWVIRLSLGRVMAGRVELFRDRGLERQARMEKLQAVLQINDDVVQGLATALLSLELDDRAATEETLRRTVAAARRVITDLLAQIREDAVIRPGDLVRDEPTE